MYVPAHVCIFTKVIVAVRGRWRVWSSIVPLVLKTKSPTEAETHLLD